MKKTSRTVMFAVALALVTQVSAIAAPVSNQNQTQQSQLEENKKSITSTENDISRYKKEILRVEEEVNAQQEVLDQRVRSMYINGQSDYLKIILESESFSDLITKVETIRKIISIDKKVISDLEEKKAEVENKKVSLEKNMTTYLR